MTVVATLTDLIGALGYTVAIRRHNSSRPAPPSPASASTALPTAADRREAATRSLAATIVRSAEVADETVPADAPGGARWMARLVLDSADGVDGDLLCAARSALASDDVAGALRRACSPWLE